MSQTGSSTPVSATDPSVVQLAGVLGLSPAQVAAIMNGGTQTVMGSGIIGQMLTALQQPITNALTARGQDIGLSEAEAQAQQATNSALIQYYSDVSQIGQAAATQNYQERLGQVQQGLQLAQQAAAERQNYVSDAMQGLQVLASRSGPQDWVAYNNLLNGMSAPTPGTQQSVNVLNLASNALNPALQTAASNVPFSSWLNNLSQPYSPPSPGSISMPNGFQTPTFTGVPADTYQPNQPGSTSNSSSTTAPALTTWPGTGTGGPGPYQTAQQAATGTSGTAHWAQDASGKWYLVANPVGADGNLETSGQMMNPGDPNQPATNYGSLSSYMGAAGTTGTMSDGTPYTNAGGSIVPAGTAGSDTNISNGPATPLGIGMPNQSVVGGVAGGSGNTLGGLTAAQQASPMQEYAKGTMSGIVDKFSHGTKTGMINDLISIIGEGKGQKPGKSKAQKTLGNTGEVVVNPTGAPFGVLNNAQSKEFLQQGALGERRNGVPPGHARGSGMKKPVTRATLTAGALPRGSLRSPSVPQFQPDQQQQQQQPQQPPIVPMGPLNYADGTGLKGDIVLGREIKRYANGSDLFNNQGQYGMPQNMVYNTYSPSQMGSQPFWQKLTGSGGPAFQGFGAPLGNSSIGISNAPSLFSLQNYNGMDPSEQQQAQSVYSQGLGVNWDDMLANAQRSAPTGVSFGPSSYGA